MIAEPTVLSIGVIAALALLVGGIHVIRRRRERRQGVLMLIAAAVILGNVLIWALPDQRRQSDPTRQAGQSRASAIR